MGLAGPGSTVPHEPPTEWVPRGELLWLTLADAGYRTGDHVKITDRTVLAAMPKGATTVSHILVYGLFSHPAMFNRLSQATFHSVCACNDRYTCGHVREATGKTQEMTGHMHLDLYR